MAAPVLWQYWHPRRPSPSQHSQRCGWGFCISTNESRGKAQHGSSVELVAGRVQLHGWDQLRCWKHCMMATGQWSMGVVQPSKSLQHIYLSDVPHQVQMSAHAPEALGLVVLQLPCRAAVALQSIDKTGRNRFEGGEGTMEAVGPRSFALGLGVCCSPRHRCQCFGGRHRHRTLGRGVCVAYNAVAAPAVCCCACRQAPR